MQRKVVGVLAVVFLVSGLVLLKWSGYQFTEAGAGAEEGGGTLAGSVLMRLGIALGAIWLALPARAEEINWSQVLTRAGLIVVGIFVLTRLKAALLLRILPMLAGIGFLVYLLRPRPKGRRRPR